MADIFRRNGYKTAMFGKWHTLGDNYPFRPHDRGFDEALYHGGGGISQTPDYWGNDYFDDTYFRNGSEQPFDGYCTDVWFQEAMAFIERQAEGSQNSPFFCYLSTQRAARSVPCSRCLRRCLPQERCARGSCEFLWYDNQY